MLLADLRHDLTRSFSRRWERRRPARGARRRRRARGPGARGPGGGGRARPSGGASSPRLDLRYARPAPRGDDRRSRLTISTVPSGSRPRSTAGTRSSTASPRPGSRSRSINLHVTVLGRRTPLSLGRGRRRRRTPARAAARGGSTSARRGSLEEVEVLDGDRMSAGQTARRPGRRRHPDDDDRRARSRSTSPATRSGSFVLQRTRGAP